MSKQLINEYRAELDRLRAVSGSRREGVLSEAFKDLLKRWGRSHDLTFTPQHEIITPRGTRIYPDGALLHALRVPFGYWEAKDADDDLDAEIAAKTRKGYPRDNIVYSDDHTAILIQDGVERARAAMDDTDHLHGLLSGFFAHERQEIADFNKAVKQFAQDLPTVLHALRDLIAEKRAASRDFAAAETAFLKHAQNAINPAVSKDDVQEMLIQHILTEDIFAKVFDNPDFHRQNNVASELYKLEEKLFERGEKSTLLRALAPYYSGIASTAAVISTHSEKQGFLKGLYENFYKVYNAKAADRLGVVYTPGEIVRFMIRSADWLCEKHFGKNLIDRGVEILDPATGTGTFIVELLESFRGHGDKLRHKYKHELHANEIAILPYYVANLNIEATYQAITGQFAEFENLCLVDTLDNVDALGIHSGHQFDLLGSLSDENIERIKRQNRRKISVIIGNPPYNANQQNENDNNKNRTYAHIDKRIKDTYIKASTAQKTKLYDMYARFYRWASDRLGDEGLVAFVTNSSFLDARTFDGFRKRIAQDFSEAWVIDLKGNARTTGERRRREGGNVFQDKIKVGVAIAFLVRKKTTTPFQVRYLSVADYTNEEDKRQFVALRNLATDQFALIKPTDDGTWLRQPDENGWSSFIPVADAVTKGASDQKRERAIFKVYTLGIVTNRDEWVYDFSSTYLAQRAEVQAKVYGDAIANPARFDPSDADEPRFSSEIKWTRLLKASARRRKPLGDVTQQIRTSAYRPFVKKWVIYNSLLNEFQYQTPLLWPDADSKNPTIAFVSEERADFSILGFDDLPNKDMFLPSAAQVTARYRYTKSGERIDNITDWGLKQFRARYGKSSPSLSRGGGGREAADGGATAEGGLGGDEDGKAQAAPAYPSTTAARRSPSPSKLGEDLKVTKDAIFAYCYAVLHDPLYREKYALNLKREFPRIPLYPDFAQWAAWGEALMALHIGYEAVAPWPVERVETPARRADGTHPKPVLKSLPEQGNVTVDADTQLTGIPPAAWTYRLGNRSAIDWVLDQHKEKKPRDPTIAAKFNTYRFADYKESMIDLLARVVRVSVETVAITEAMRALDRSGWE